MALLVAVLPQLPAQAQMANTQTPENWRDSLSVLNSQIKLSAWNTDLHLRKAAVNLELQQWQYAIDEYGLILQHEAQNPAALFYRAYANTHLRRYDMARRDYEELLQIFPRHAEARLSLAYVLQLMGRKTDALDHLNTLVEQNPDSAVAYASRAALEREMKQYEASLYDWQQAINRDPKNIGYLASKVDLLVSLNRRKEALREFEAASRRGIPQGVINKLKHEF
jgi:tetratricopeptide (TPR) repeat protein